MSDFLAALGPADRAVLESVGLRRRYRAGETLARELDDPGGVWVLLDGEVAASTLGSGGKEVLLGLAGAGELVGELAALRGTRRSATLRARTDVEALAIAATDFRRFLHEVPGAALMVLDTVMERLEVADAQRRELAALDVVARVARRLLELSERAGGAGTVEITHDELAAWTGASREAVTKALAVLRSLGAVHTGRGRVELVQVDVLRRRAAT